ncbi:MAG: xanthine dehydrogenase family protein molybdopterin-binding subunit [Acidobacteriaceae bacterium]|nr:xanthine dehydrogenase family protein molybdopterin-binding subunit [Acidobacteriaceae bacterium]
MSQSQRPSTYSDCFVTPSRLEGSDKVTGRARYTGDLGPAHIGRALLHVAVVQSKCASGWIRQIDIGGAEAVPGFRSAVTHLNAPRLKPVKTLTSSELDAFLPLQDERIRYYGQPVALIAGETLQAAQHAASLVRVMYECSPAALLLEQQLTHATAVKKVAGREPAMVKRGRPGRAFSTAPVQIEVTYTTKPAHHNPIEPGATIAVWEDETHITAWNTSQFVYGDATTLGQAFGFGPHEQKMRIIPHVTVGVDLGGKIRVIAPLVGGGFGSKGANASLLLAAMAAKVAGAGVKLVLTRKQTYSVMPYRSGVVQRLRLGASPEGRLSALLHDATVQNSTVGSFTEPVGELTPHLYSCEHLRTTHKIVRLNVNAPGWMRAPGAAPGIFGLECAMDELAEKLNLDPVELRLRNYADLDPQSGQNWSSKSLKECYRLAGERIGWWTERRPLCGSMREDGLLIGFGMASAAYLTTQFPSVASVTLTGEGEAIIETAVHEIGQGAITALSQIAAESLGVPLGRIRLKFGDTALPFAFITAGSATTLSAGTAIKNAAERLKRDVILRAITDRASPLYKLHFRDVIVQAGKLVSSGDFSRSEDLVALLARHSRRTFSAKAITGRTFGKSRYARCAFGAQFARVAVNPETAQIRVQRMVGAFGCGRIINPKLARSQLLGGMIWGLGQALLEQTVLDEKNGSWVNSNLAEALVPTNSDVPPMEVLFAKEDDSRGSALGAKGLGEIGITGVAAAITNAVYHATGKRIRELPIRLDRLLAT